MSGFKIVQDYPYPVETVWRALTDPELIPLWTATGQGARPEGFSTVVGTKFRFVAKPMPGWDGIVRCEVLEAQAPSYFSYTWAGAENDPVTTVTYRLEPYENGTRFIWEHTGFQGVGGFAMSKLLASVRKKMLSVGLPALLADMDAMGDSAPGTASERRRV